MTVLSDELFGLPIFVMVIEELVTRDKMLNTTTESQISGSLQSNQGDGCYSNI